MDLIESLKDLPNNFPRTTKQLVDGVAKVPMAPLFLIIHYILVTLSLRQRAGLTFINFTKCVDLIIKVHISKKMALYLEMFSIGSVIILQWTTVREIHL